LTKIERVRPLSEITFPDPRHVGRGNVPTALYESLADIVLNDSVPADIQQLFETAKNLSLYTWFSFRFHPIARVVAYSCLEAALRHRVADIPKFRRPEKPNWFPGFKDMLEHAVKESWIRNEGFENARLRARSVAKQKLTYAQIAKMRAEEIDEMPTSEPTDEQVRAELAALPYAHGLVEAWPFIRNWIAHGNEMVGPGSVAALRVVAEAINQLFPENSRNAVG
jgi:hypothetical protein